MNLLVWVIGYLFTVGIYKKHIRGKWYTIVTLLVLLCVAWPYFLGYLLRDCLTNPNDKVIQ